MRLTLASVGALLMVVASLWAIAVLIFDKHEHRAWTQITIIFGVLLVGFGFALGASISDAIWTLRIEDAVREVLDRG